jgi:histone H3/H4
VFLYALYACRDEELDESSPSLKRKHEGDVEAEGDVLDVPASSNKQDKHKIITIIPVGRVKKLVKHDIDVKNIGQEALSIITRATEIFLRDLTAKAMDGAMQDKKKSITYKHICT